jgi:Flp pilus assembly pilin Flp
MKELFRRLAVDQSPAPAIEYGLNAGLVAFFLIWAWIFVRLLGVLLV